MHVCLRWFRGTMYHFKEEQSYILKAIKRNFVVWSCTLNNLMLWIYTLHYILYFRLNHPNAEIQEKLLVYIISSWPYFLIGINVTKFKIVVNANERSDTKTEIMRHIMTIYIRKIPKTKHRLWNSWRHKDLVAFALLLEPLQSTT